MSRLTVSHFFTRQKSRGYVLDDQHRFAKMLIFASFFHMILFLSFDFTYQVPVKKLLSTMIDVTLMPSVETVEVTNSEAATQPLQDTATHEGIRFEMNGKKVKSDPHVRKRTISAASHEKRDAPYLDRWQAYVEHFGNSHYPEVALRNRLRGDLRLLVALNKDGSIHEVSIRSSSGSSQLDQAAVDLVYQAAPFEPLPTEITTDTEILEIIRTWQFRGELSTS